jgi:integrase
MGRGGIESPHYSARIGHQKRRERFPLYTPNKEAAASKAAQIFGYILDHGWDATIEKFKPQAVPVVEEVEQPPALGQTVGELIKASLKYASARLQSLEAYARAFRQIAYGSMQLEDIETFPLRRDCGNTVWREKCDAIELKNLTPMRIQNWKQQFLITNGKTGSARRKATITVNSLIRNGKALFAKKVIPFLEQEVELPTPLPFEGVTMEKPPSTRYRSKIDAKEILKLGHKELKHSNPEAYKILLLALVCGLRVSEIDYMLWDAFDFDNSILAIMDTEYHQLKSEDSAGELALSAEMKEIFSAYEEQATGIFVIESRGKIERSNITRSYRCKGALDFLRGWLRKNGVDSIKPIHELRNSAKKRMS